MKDWITTIGFVLVYVGILSFGLTIALHDSNNDLSVKVFLNTYLLIMFVVHPLLYGKWIGFRLRGYSIAFVGIILIFIGFIVVGTGLVVVHVFWNENNVLFLFSVLYLYAILVPVLILLYVLPKRKEVSE